MKVSSGLFKGSKLSTKTNHEIRPATEKARSWIFQEIEKYLPGSKILDLFAGTGSLGIESLSRGSEEGWFVEYLNHSLTRKNIDNIVKNKKSKVVRDKVEYFIKKKFTHDLDFDIIFTHPPYIYDRSQEIFEHLSGTGILKNGGIFIFERSKHSKPVNNIENFTILKEKSLGETIITIYKKAKN